jgi:hypothetical protein
MKDYGDFTLVLDYSKNFNQLIESGKYDRVKSDVMEKNFPWPIMAKDKKIITRANVFYFSGSYNSERIILEMKRDGYRPANSLELLSLGAQYPELQIGTYIIALNAVRDNKSKDVLALSHSGKKRCISTISTPANTWIAGLRFLGVHG